MADESVAPMVAPSQGIHLVFDASFLKGDSAIMVPHTSDGRVMFAIPWHGHTLVGTTDTAISQVSLEPVPMEQEIQFILETSALYLDKPPSRSDILSSWAGIRPLVKAAGGGSTASLSRDHSIHIDPSGLLTIAGGKWTTYRHMAEDCVDQAIVLAGGRPALRHAAAAHPRLPPLRVEVRAPPGLWFGRDPDPGDGAEPPGPWRSPARRSALPGIRGHLGRPVGDGPHS